MKRKLLFTIILTFILMLTMATPVLAWDNEDTLVADNDDFLIGTGIDYGNSLEIHKGEQGWGSGDGYNLYIDEYSESGNLDMVSIATYSPEDVDLPTVFPGFWIFPAILGDAEANAWYWDTEPRGTDDRVYDPNTLTVNMRFGTSGNGRYVSEEDNTLKRGVEVDGRYDGAQYMLVIPEGCVIEQESGERLNWLFLSRINGNDLTFTNGDGRVEFSEPCILYAVEGGTLAKDKTGEWVGDGEWVEVGSFIEIVDEIAILN